MADRFIITDFSFEDGEPVELGQLRTGRAPKRVYNEGLQYSVRATNDIFLYWHGGILLTRRKVHPANGELWPLGGGKLRGYFPIDSLEQVVSNEGGNKLNLLRVAQIGSNDCFFRTDSAGHGKGTHDSLKVYYAEAEGELKLNRTLNQDPHLVIPVNSSLTGKVPDDITLVSYVSKFRGTLHPFLQIYLDMLMPCIREQDFSGFKWIE